MSYSNVRLLQQKSPVFQQILQYLFPCIGYLAYGNA